MQKLKIYLIILNSNIKQPNSPLKKAEKAEVPSKVVVVKWWKIGRTFRQARKQQINYSYAVCWKEVEKLFCLLERGEEVELSAEKSE